MNIRYALHATFVQEEEGEEEGEESGEEGEEGEEEEEEGVCESSDFQAV